MLPFLRPPFSLQTADSRHQFVDWLTGRDGQALLDAEMAQLQTILPSLVGFRALQIGVGQERSFLDACHFPYRWQVASTAASNVDLQVKPARLPFARECIDLVLLHHSLDFDDHPYRILNEATRVLNLGGTLVVVGFNPVSLLGLQRFFSSRTEPPLSGRFLRAGRVSDWAGVCSCQVLGYASGLHGSREGSVTGWLGRKLWQRLGGFYVLIARKQAYPMQPLRPKRQRLADMPPNVISVPAARWQRTRNPN